MRCDFGDEFLPKRATKGSAGYDIVSPMNISCQPVNLGVAGYTMMDTGLHLEDGDLADDEVMLIVPRSSLGFRYGMRFANTVCVIDSDYRDSIKLAFTVDRDILNIRKGDRIAQGIIVRFGRMPGEQVPTAERKGGLGSTDGVR